MLVLLIVLFLAIVNGVEIAPLCCDRESSLGPVRLQWVNDTCFNTTFVGLERLGCTGPCCDNEINRIDLRVKSDCRGAIKDIEVVPQHPGDLDNSNVLMQWNYDLLSFINVWEGYTYCVELDTAVCDAPRLADICTDEACEYSVVDPFIRCCPTFKMPTLSPPPPPPPPPPEPELILAPKPPPSEFPYCKCIKDRASQYTLQFDGVNAEGEQCFQVRMQDACVDSTSPCCTFDLHKIEFAIPNACLGTVSHARVNGIRRAISQAWNLGSTKDKAVFKITNLNIPATVVQDGVEVCLKLRENVGACREIDAYCGGNGLCTYALFQKQRVGDRYCCIVDNVSV
jgi:hypothetical protein